ncbi:MAG: hypothetical protein LRY38_04065 [Aeromonadaceae bacterium]|nr:hypothetical protein [Aeromonadaceae bacterium]
MLLRPPCPQQSLGDYLAGLRVRLQGAVPLLDGLACWVPHLQLAAACYPDDGLCAEGLLQQTRGRH